MLAHLGAEDNLSGLVTRDGANRTSLPPRTASRVPELCASEHEEAHHRRDESCTLAKVSTLSSKVGESSRAHT